ncbi:MAG: KTSC domain-containing protein [Dehalococcoidia bacterium]
MDMIPVSSSNVAAIGYDDATELLQVRFHNGSLYAYSGVPSSVFQRFLSAPSKGSFVHEELKDRYPYRRIG